MIVGSLLFIGFLLFCPEAAISGSKYGCSLWICELIPTLLPFFIALNFFRLQLKKASEHPAFLLLGLLCGYPAGADLVSKQYEKGLLTTDKAYFYLGFVNNPSPMFIMGYCCSTILNVSTPKAILFFLTLVLSAFLGSFFVSFILKITGRNKNTFHGSSTQNACSPQKLSFSKLMDKIILDSFILITKIGGYVILFFDFCLFLENAFAYLQFIRHCLSWFYGNHNRNVLCCNCSTFSANKRSSKCFDSCLWRSVCSRTNEQCSIAVRTSHFPISC